VEAGLPGPAVPEPGLVVPEAPPAPEGDKPPTDVAPPAPLPELDVPVLPSGAEAPASLGPAAVAPVDGHDADAPLDVPGASDEQGSELAPALGALAAESTITKGIHMPISASARFRRGRCNSPSRLSECGERSREPIDRVDRWECRALHLGHSENRRTTGRKLDSWADLETDAAASEYTASTYPSRHISSRCDPTRSIPQNDWLTLRLFVY
jgi:hypothetical protein